MTTWKNDGGHGGGDPGAVFGGNIEKIYTLEASLYVNRRMQELGISSSTTRTKDMGLSQATRTSKMKTSKKGMSHHFNAGGGTGAEFIHSIHSNGSFEKLLVDEFKKAGYPLRNKPIYTRRLLDDPKSPFDHYYMHRQTGGCRVTIIEYEFVDGSNKERIKNKTYREGMYECVVRAVCREEGVTYREPNANKDGEVFYRVVTGSFKQKKNAEDRIEQLKAKGFDSFIDIYRK